MTQTVFSLPVGPVITQVKGCFHLGSLASYVSMSRVTFSFITGLQTLKCSPCHHHLHHRHHHHLFLTRLRQQTTTCIDFQIEYVILLSFVVLCKFCLYVDFFPLINLQLSLFLFRWIKSVFVPFLSLCLPVILLISNPPPPPSRLPSVFAQAWDRFDIRQSHIGD